MTIHWLRVSVDLPYEADKPISGPHQVLITNRTATYLRTAATDGLENKMKVLFREDLYNQHAHHHDARYGRCRPDLEASTDGLGPIEE